MSRNLRKWIIGAIIYVTVLLIISPSVFAATPHENPETAEQVFSGISLLRHYSSSLDFVLRKAPAEVETRLQKMPFANIPQSMKEATENFASSGIDISHVVVEIDENLGKLRALMEQFRLDEAMELAGQTSDKLFQANSELELIQQATETTGKELKVPLAPEGSDLRQSYDEVLDRIDRIRQMLALYQNLLESMGMTPEELFKATGMTPEELFEATSMTLEVQPTVAFVGDSIRFEGVLTSEGEPLAGREVDILINSSRYVTVKTDAYGHYQGTLQVPYWYIPELDLQALYYPRDKDIGLYIASLSPVIKLKVLFYEAGLEVRLEDKAYPGLETTVTGRFDYGQSPPLNERKVEIYFDDILISEVMAQEAFAQKIRVDPQVDVVEHIITVSAVSEERYSPVVASAILSVTRATPILDLSVPRVSTIPGSVGLEGRLYSEVGPLSGALIKMRLGKSQVELVSSEDGTFNTKIGVGIGFGLIGSQDLVIQVLPQEPWHASLETTRSVMIVNMINFSGILAILIFLILYLPSRLRVRIGTYPKRKLSPMPTIARSEIAPAYRDDVIALLSTKENGQSSGEPRARIFYWYRLAARLLQGITKMLFKPNQTLREYARENSRVPRPVAKYFIELTKIVERLLYSQYRPTDEDVEKSKQLSHTIEEELKGEGV